MKTLHTIVLNSIWIKIVKINLFFFCFKYNCSHSFFGAVHLWHHIYFSWAKVRFMKGSAFKNRINELSIDLDIAENIVNRETAGWLLDLNNTIDLVFILNLLKTVFRENFIVNYFGLINLRREIEGSFNSFFYIPIRFCSLIFILIFKFKSVAQISTKEFPL